MKKKNIILCISIIAFLIGMGTWLILGKHSEYSYSERRFLKKKPKFTLESFLSGSYATEFEEYALDQFPLRDKFRTIKAMAEKYVFAKKSNNKIYSANGHLSKIEYPLNSAMIDNATERFKNIYDKFLQDKGIKPYLAVVPDKNYYLAEKNGVLSMDYEKLFSTMKDSTMFMNSIDLTDLLSIDHYYNTDIHWRQERILEVAERIAHTMGTDVTVDYETMTLAHPFEGVYVAQSALPVKADIIKYVTNKTLENCIVTNYDTGMPVIGKVYDMDKAFNMDSYEMFLSGATPLITIENPNNKNGKELIMFRDSFGSSLAPLLIEGYTKITLIDIRYIQSDALDTFIEFDNQDVLFIYSTLLLNNSLSLK